MPSPNPFVVNTDTLTGQLRPLRRAALALGSNLGDRLDMLQGAVDALAAAPDIRALAVSSVYETDAVGGPDQGPFLNAVVVVETPLDARVLMERAQAIEDTFGRARDVRWGPRTLDVDVLAVGDSSLVEPDLSVPHPRLHERAFVLVPWSEIDAGFTVPGLGTVAELRARVSDVGVRLLADEHLLLPG